MLNNKIIIAYVPVLHQGYLSFFKRHSDARILFIFGEDLLETFPEIEYVYRKDAIRAISSEDMRIAISSLGIFENVFVLRKMDLRSVMGKKQNIILPDEDVTRIFYAMYLKDEAVFFDSVFLRWNKDNVDRTDSAYFDRSISISEFAKEAMYRALFEAEKSACWWRQVGGVVAKDCEILLWAHNDHMPFPEAHYTFGDPRDMFPSGVRLEMATVQHTERALCAEALNRGLSFKGVDLYITDFPCGPCAMAIAPTGIRRLYFIRGSATLDGESILRSNGIEIVRVELPSQ